MLTVLKIFFRAPGTKPWFVLGCLVLASLSEGIGVASLLPLLTSAVGTPDAETSGLNRLVIDTLETLGLPTEFDILLLIVIGGTVLKGLLTLFAMRYVGYAVAQVSTRLREGVIKNTLRARWRYFVAQPVGRITNAVSNEAMRASMAYSTAADFLADVIQTLAYLTVAFLLSWELSLAAMVVGGVILGVLNFLVEMGRRAGNKHTKRIRELITYLNDVLNNIKPLKAMAQEDSFERYLSRKLDGLRNALRKEVTSSAFLKSFQEILIAVAMGIGFYISFKFWGVAITELIVMYLVIAKVIKNLARIQRQYQKTAAAESPYIAVHAMIQEARDAEEKLHGGRVPRFEEACRVQDVSFAYGAKQVLDRINLEIPAQGVTVLMGASGAGKTTLTDVLLGFNEPDGGAVLLDGVPLTEVDLHAWRRSIGYVPQEFQLFHDTVMMNVTLGDDAIGEVQVREALKSAGALDFVLDLPEGLNSRVGERGSQLSGGQRQRIALARALARKPSLLILDEVTSALDPNTEKEICQTLRSIARQTSVLAITHQPQLLEIADRAYRVEAGTAEVMDLTKSLVV